MSSKPTIEDAIGDFRTIAAGHVVPVVKPKRVRKAKPNGKLTPAEVTKRSTPEERAAVERYDAMKHMTWMGETDMLLYGQAVGIIVARNKRLGLIP